MPPTTNPTKVKSGLEVLLDDPAPWLADRRLGLLCNPASVDRHLVHARVRIAERFAGRLEALYSPQHGFFAEKQDNMIESSHRRDPLLGIPVFSLYGTARRPTADMLAPIDVLLVDLQDVGCRVYTFVWTLSYCMEAAARHGRQVVVLDRPNPIGGAAVEGNLLDPAWASFVGRYPLPMRHGLTMGELARWLNEAHDIGCDLTVVPMAGWRRRMYFIDTGLPWVAPSPNMPTPATALVYPGQVLWEGTNVSEGRGTTQPFELVGAPFLDPDRLAADISARDVPGVTFRPVVFEPTSGKWAGEPCGGVQLHVTDTDAYAPYITSLMLLQAVRRQAGEAFAWKPPPYEYEFARLPIDLILGDGRLRLRLEEAGDPAALRQDWTPALKDFAARSRSCHLYGE